MMPPGTSLALHPFTHPHVGWVHAHNAIRSDLTALDELVGAFRSQLASGRGLTRSQAAAALRFVHCFLKFVHDHHRNEDGE